MSTDVTATTAPVSTPFAPAAIGPNSQAVAAARFLYISGQLPIDPVTGLIDGDTAAEQTARSLTNLGAILEVAGLALDDVVKTTVFLGDLADFAAMNQAYAQAFTGPVLPARSAVQVAALPRGAKVEIEAVARLQGA